MRFNCPCCGERGLDEFVYYGDATVTRPDASAATAMADFLAYAYDRSNVAGLHRELWYHAAGCHLWLVVTRNVVTHEVKAVERARDVALARTSDAHKLKVEGSVCCRFNQTVCQSVASSIAARCSAFILTAFRIMHTLATRLRQRCSRTA
jgi:methylglutamate dehydrogenase subunit B